MKPTGESAPRCRLAVRAQPNAPRSEIVGWLGDALKVKLHAPALEGRANEELCRVIAEALGLPTRTVRLIQGEKSRQKLLEITGLTPEQVGGRLKAEG